MSLLGNLLTHAIPSQDPAFLLNLMASVFSAAAAAIVALAALELTGSWPAGALAGLGLGVSRVFWQQALGIEVFGLNALFAALLLWIVSRAIARRHRSPAALELPGALAVLSTAVTHHQTLLLLGLPAIAVLSALALATPSSGHRIDRSDLIRRCLIALVVGLLPVLYLPIAAHFDPRMSWGDIHDVTSFVHVLLRKDFGTGLMAGPNLAVSQVLRFGEQVSPLGWRHYRAFWADLPLSLGWGMLGLAMLGMRWARRRDFALLGLLLGFLATLTLFFSRANIPLTPLGLSITRRFFVLPHVMIAFFAGMGVAQLLAWTQGRRWLHRTLGVIVPVAAVVPMLIVQFPRVDQRNNCFTRDFGRNLLVGVPPRAIFFTSGDLFDFSLRYEQCAESRRRDVTLVSQDLLPHRWYVAQLVNRGQLASPTPPHEATTERPPPRSVELLDANADAYRANGRPAVAVTLADASYETRYRLIPAGIWSRTERLDSTISIASARAYARTVARWDLTSLDRRYPMDTWESTEGVFYSFAVGQFQGLYDVGLLNAATADSIPGHFVDGRVARWSAGQRADVLAYRADFIRSCLTDSITAVRAENRMPLARLAMELCDRALQLDSANVQALQTGAALRSTQVEFHDELGEYAVRRRLVELRPGELSELVPYFRLALHADFDPSAVPRVRADAERVKARFLRLLRICQALSAAPEFSVLERRWSAPLEDIPDLR